MTFAAALAVGTLSVVNVGDAAAIGTTRPVSEAKSDGLMVNPKLADSRSLSAQAAVIGTLTDANGAPIGGATVILWAWPTDQVLRALKLGAATSLGQVAWTQTASNGSFTLRPAVNDLAQFRGKQGIVNFTIDTDSPDYQASYSFSRRVVEGTAARSTKDETAATYLAAPGVKGRNPRSAPPAVVSLMASETQVLTSESTEPEPSETAAEFDDGSTETEQTVPESNETAGRLGCQTILKSKYLNIGAIVGQTFSKLSTVSMGSTYSTGSTSSLGISTSASGRAGTFSNSGSSETTSSGEVTFPRKYGFGAYYRTSSFDYGRFYYRCIDFRTGVTYNEKWFYRATGWAGGARTVNAGKFPTASRCTQMERGSSWTAVNGRAVTWANGVNASVTGIGFDLSISSGYNSKTQSSYSFDGGGGWLCGKNAPPAQNPALLVAAGTNAG